MDKTDAENELGKYETVKKEVEAAEGAWIQAQEEASN